MTKDRKPRLSFRTFIKIPYYEPCRPHDREFMQRSFRTVREPDEQLHSYVFLAMCAATQDDPAATMLALETLETFDCEIIWLNGRVHEKRMRIGGLTGPELHKLAVFGAELNHTSYEIWGEPGVWLIPMSPECVSGNVLRIEQKVRGVISRCALGPGIGADDPFLRPGFREFAGAM